MLDEGENLKNQPPSTPPPEETESTSMETAESSDTPSETDNSPVLDELFGEQKFSTQLGDGKAVEANRQGIIERSPEGQDKKIEKPSGASIAGDEGRPARDIQNKLQNYYNLIFPMELRQIQPGETPQSAQERLDKQYPEKLAALEAERKHNVWGPASQELYQSFLKTFSDLVPIRTAEMARLGLPIKDDSPMPVPRTPDGRPVDADTLAKLAVSGMLQYDMQIDASKVPDAEALGKIEPMLDWMGKAKTQIETEELKHYDDSLRLLIDTNGLPEEWKNLNGMDPADWRERVRDHINFYTSLKNYAVAGYKLAKDAKYSSFQFELPPGMKLIESKDGRIDIDSGSDVFPKDLTQNPANTEKRKAYEAWNEKFVPVIEKTFKDLNKVPTVFKHEDEMVPEEYKAVFKDGKFDRLELQGYELKDGETTQFANLLRHSIDIEQSKDGSYKFTQTTQAMAIPWCGYLDLVGFGVGDPKVAGHTFQPQDSVKAQSGGKPVFLHAESLAQFRKGKSFEYWAGKGINIAMDGVLIAAGGVKILTAGGKMLLPTLAKQAGKEAIKLSSREATMLALRGGFDVAAGLTGVLSNANAEHSGWQEIANHIRGGYFLSHGIYGATLPKAIDQKVVRTVGKIPGLSFVEGTANASEKFAKLSEGIKFRQQPLAWLATSGLNRGGQIAEWGLGAELTTGLSHTRADLTPHMEEAEQIRGHRKPDEVPDPDKFKVKSEAPSASLEDILTTHQDTIQEGVSRDLERHPNGYDHTKDLLAKRQIGGIYKKALDIVSRDKPDATDEEKAQLAKDKGAFVQELLSHFSLSAESVKKIEERMNFYYEKKNGVVTLSSDDLHEYAMGEHARELADEKLSPSQTTDSRVRAAALDALIAISVDSEGKLPDKIGTFSLEIPSQTVHAIESDRDEQMKLLDIPQHKIDLNISAADLATFLKKEIIANNNNLSSAAIPIADDAYRLNQLSGIEYAAVLRDYLSNSEVSKETKIRALVDNTGPRFIDLTENISAIEELVLPGEPKETAKAAGLLLGVSSSELKDALDQMVESEKDPDLRAAAAASLFGLNQRTRYNELIKSLANIREATQGSALDLMLGNGMFDPRTVAIASLGAQANQTLEELLKNQNISPNFLARNADIWQTITEGPEGKTREKIIEALTKGMETPIPLSASPEETYLIREQKLSAAVMLNRLSPDKQEQISEAIKSCLPSPSEIKDLQNYGNDPIQMQLYLKNLDLASRTVSELSKSNRLNNVDSETISNLFSLTSSFVRAPQTKAEETAMVGLLQASKHLFKHVSKNEETRAEHTEDMQALSSQFQRLIETTNPNFINNSAAIRAEICTALANLGDGSALDIIRARTSAARKPTYLPKESNLRAEESSATVRIAALDALQELRDPLLPTILGNLYTSETDAAVRAEVSRLMALNNRPVPLNPIRDQSNTSFQQAEVNPLRDTRSAYFDSLTSQQLDSQLHTLFPLLFTDAWKTERNNRSDEAWSNISAWKHGDFDWWFSGKEYLNNRVTEEGVKVVDQERSDQATSLANLARGFADNPQVLNALLDSVPSEYKSGDPAKVAKEIAAAFGQKSIYEIITRLSSSMSYTETQPSKIYPQYNMPQYKNKTSNDWINAYSEVLAKCVTEANPTRAQAAEYVRRLLTENHNLPAQARTTLLNAWIKAATDGSGNESSASSEKISAVQHADVMWAALKNTMENALNLDDPNAKNKYENRSALLNTLITEIKKVGFRDHNDVETLRGYLATSSEAKHISEMTQIHLERSFNDMQYSIQAPLRHAREDSVIDANSRADQLKRSADTYASLLKRNLDSFGQEKAADDLVKSIFAYYKGHSFENENDPGIGILSNLLDQKHEEVQLAAAYAIMEASHDLPGNSEIRNKAAAALAHVAMTTKNETYRKEAMEKICSYGMPCGHDFNGEDWTQETIKEKDNEIKRGSKTIEIPPQGGPNGKQEGRKYQLNWRMPGELSIVEQTGDKITGAIYTQGNVTDSQNKAQAAYLGIFSFNQTAGNGSGPVLTSFTHNGVRFEQQRQNPNQWNVSRSASQLNSLADSIGAQGDKKFPETPVVTPVIASAKLSKDGTLTIQFLDKSTSSNGKGKSKAPGKTTVVYRPS